LIVDGLIVNGNPPDSSLTVNMLDRQKELYGRYPLKVALDGGFASKTTLYDQDVCKVLKILPCTFRQRMYRGYYPEFQKIGVKRIFTLEQIKELIKITEGLILRGVVSAGSSD
jgi:hypothetical protein